MRIMKIIRRKKNNNQSEEEAKSIKVWIFTVITAVGKRIHMFTNIRTWWLQSERTITDEECDNAQDTS